jgi:hypothetical protein
LKSLFGFTRLFRFVFPFIVGIFEAPHLQTFGSLIKSRPDLSGSFFVIASRALMVLGARRGNLISPEIASAGLPSLAKTKAETQ